MALNEQEFQKILNSLERYAVFYYYSTEEYLARSYASRTLTALARETDAEVTRIDGPAPSIGEAVAAAGTISLFGTKRVVELAQVEPSAMNDADVDALCDLFATMENAVIVLYTVFKDDKAKQTKKAKKMLDAAGRFGIAADILKPGVQDAKRFIQQKAQEMETELEPGADTDLLERCGADLFLLENEVSKLAAASGYTRITRELVSAMGTQNIEADVFEMVRYVTAKNKPRAFQKLNQLLELQNEPIAIAAALAGSFIDMYRVKCGAASRKNYAAVHKDFHYRGSDYRLRKSGETASRYTLHQLASILELLERLDASLKSSAADKNVLLQTTLCEIMQVGDGRS